MKQLGYILVLLFAFKTANAQVIYDAFQSEKLGAERQIKIQLPRGYEANTDKKYPICVVLDGDYLFEAVAGNIDYYSYWEDMPETIVVGVNQAEFRDFDTAYSGQNSLPIDSGANFFEFIGMELVPYIENKYRTENFRVIVGHGLTANFVNYYMFKPVPLFQAYVSISPDLAGQVPQYISERLPQFESKLFYYMAVGENDNKRIKAETEALDKKIKAIDNKNLLYNYNMFEGASHYNTPARAIPRALESIFLVYQPISKKEYKETILNLEGSPIDYLTEKYQTIKDLFGIDKRILVNDFKAVAAAIKKKERFEDYEILGKMARKEYPNTVLGHYYLARFYEETGNTKKAMKTYQSGYVFDEIGGITKDLMLEKSEEIKADFGY